MALATTMCFRLLLKEIHYDSKYNVSFFFLNRDNNIDRTLSSYFGK